MTAGPGAGAGLYTPPALTVSGVTHLAALVSPTRQGPPTLLATGDSVHQAGNVPPLLPAAVADLGGQLGAGGAVPVAVAGVEHRVTTGVISPAHLHTVRRLGPTRYRRVDHGCPALAGQLREAHIVTGVTVASVTVLLAVVQLAGEQLVTQERTGVLHSDAAQLPALVSATASLLLTFPLTASIVSPSRHLVAGQLLVHVATPAPHTGGERTGRAGPEVTVSLAAVGS